MTDHPQIDRFLDGLGEQRARLLRLVGPDADPGEPGRRASASWCSRLVVAEEEPAGAARGACSRPCARCCAARASATSLLGAAEDAHVVTDDQGLVLSVNRAAERLVRQPLARRTPRPLATWFVLDDRHAVRTALGAARDGRDVLPLTPVRLARAGAPDLPVSLEVTRAVEPRTGRTVLRWHLHEPGDRAARPRRAAGAGPAPGRRRRRPGVLALVQEPGRPLGGRPRGRPARSPPAGGRGRRRAWCRVPTVRCSPSACAATRATPWRRPTST
ncbi:hypothetical protein GCM10025868_01220 [Angustibacter aerolatus]|uniref:PAS domain-containing protein n=1 Tax=Angustibacter aerolatus TaxID=1162965 RepID=A0ABQ6JD98_9ACTN|nr:hypothetical protein [Angustibacter aerolatus]GMA84872.1 hypothetical protein GCM10025868_01220 [Angustibacter aerolatus]